MRIGGNIGHHDRVPLLGGHPDDALPGPDDELFLHVSPEFHADRLAEHLLVGIGEQDAENLVIDHARHQLGGAVQHLQTLTRGRVSRIGDAAGFVSGTTGEGIYPGMVSAEIAAEVIHRALARGAVETGLQCFNQAWRSELGDYVKRLPGGGKENETRGRIEMIFGSPFVARVAGRIFLYGEKVSLTTAAKALANKG